MNRYVLLRKWLQYRLAKVAPTSKIRTHLLRKLGARIAGSACIMEDVVFVNYTDLQYLVVGDEAGIGSGCTLILSEYHDRTCITKHKKPFKGYIHIKKGAYVGANVTVFPGITIGENSVVGACSLVNKSIPDNSLAYGVPARVIRKLE